MNGCFVGCAMVNIPHGILYGSVMPYAGAKHISLIGKTIPYPHSGLECLQPYIFSLSCTLIVPLSLYAAILLSQASPCKAKGVGTDDSDPTPMTLQDPLRRRKNQPLRLCKGTRQRISSPPHRVAIHSIAHIFRFVNRFAHFLFFYFSRFATGMLPRRNTVKTPEHPGKL